MANQKAGQGKKKPYRPRFNFWLNMDKPEEKLIANKIQALKLETLFTATIRDGIRLICDLRDGKLDVLFELFPWVRAEFLQYMREVAVEALPEPSPETLPEYQQFENERAWLEAEQERLEQERAWQERRLAEAQQALEAERRNIEQERQRIEAERTASQTSIQKQLTRLEELLISQGHQPIERPIEQDSHHPNAVNPVENRPGRPKQLVVPKFTAPPSTDDDDDDEDLLEWKKDESAAMRATQNFLRSVSGLTDETKHPPKTNGSYSTGGKRRYKQAKELGQ
jgi:hypothetical protein